jgi:hypothetical protein
LRPASGLLGRPVTSATLPDLTPTPPTTNGRTTDTQPKAGAARYIVKFKENQPLDAAASICDEMKGALGARQQRFRGFCDSTFFKLQPAGAAKLDWRFLPVTLKGKVCGGLGASILG